MFNLREGADYKDIEGTTPRHEKIHQNVDANDGRISELINKFPDILAHMMNTFQNNERTEEESIQAISLLTDISNFFLCSDPEIKKYLFTFEIDPIIQTLFTCVHSDQERNSVFRTFLILLHNQYICINEYYFQIVFKSFLLYAQNFVQNQNQAQNGFDVEYFAVLMQLLILFSSKKEFFKFFDLNFFNCLRVFCHKDNQVNSLIMPFLENILKGFSDNCDENEDEDEDEDEDDSFIEIYLNFLTFFVSNLLPDQELIPGLVHFLKENSKNYYVNFIFCEQFMVDYVSRLFLLCDVEMKMKFLSIFRAIPHECTRKYVNNTVINFVGDVLKSIVCNEAKCQECFIHDSKLIEKSFFFLNQLYSKDEEIFTCNFFSPTNNFNMYDILLAILEYAPFRLKYRVSQCFGNFAQGYKTQYDPGKFYLTDNSLSKSAKIFSLIFDIDDFECMYLNMCSLHCFRNRLKKIGDYSCFDAALVAEGVLDKLIGFLESTNLEKEDDKLFLCSLIQQISESVQIANT